MQRVRRSRMTVSDQAEIWDRWKRGQSLSEIGRALDRMPGRLTMLLLVPEKRMSKYASSASTHRLCFRQTAQSCPARPWQTQAART